MAAAVVVVVSFSFFRIVESQFSRVKFNVAWNEPEQKQFFGTAFLLCSSISKNIQYARLHGKMVHMQKYHGSFHPTTDRHLSLRVSFVLSSPWRLPQ